jgi:hypothetical protein
MSWRSFFAGGLLLACLLSGCTFSSRTNIAMLDGTSAPTRLSHTNRTTTSVVVYQQGKKPTRPYKEIALFTVDGEGREEASAVQGFIDLGRKCGADAILVDRTATLKREGGGRIVDTQSKEGVEGSGGDTIYFPNGRCVFRATAVVWTSQ